MTPTSPGPAQSARETRLLTHYTFEEFVVGPHNRFPHAAAQAVSENLGKAYNPLFLYGPVGLGKTHLMQAVGHRVLEKNPSASVLYVTAEQFMTEVIDLVQRGDLKALREKYRGLDLLLVDDVQFLSASESTQEEFFHTFNQLHQAGKQIIMTSDRPPKLLTTLEDRLRSRFEWGLIADIKLPNLETRVAILRKKETQMGTIKLGEDIRLFIAGMLKSNVRELEGFLRRVQAYAQLNSQEVNLPLVKEIMRELLPPGEWQDDAAPRPATPPAAPAPVSAPAAPPAPAPRPAAPDIRMPDLSTFAPPAAPRPAVPAPASVPPAPAEPALRAEEIVLPVAPAVPAPAAGAAADPGFKSIPVAFFYPQDKEAELLQARKRFEEIIKKHKLKFQLDPAVEMGYPLDDAALSYEVFADRCVEKNLMIAIVIGPPPDSRLRESIFQQRVQELFDTQHLSLQMIPWEELAKDYRYLNLALDITLIRFKQKGGR